MITAETFRSPAYAQFESGTLQLHATIRAGRLNSPEADDLREGLADLWPDMTPEQRQFGNAFSGDLYMLDANAGETFEPATDDERSPHQLGMAIKATWDRRDWADALALLRKGPTFFAPPVFASLRARAYGQLDRPAAALAFVRHARRLDPASATYRMLELEWMMGVGQVTDATSLAWLYALDPGEQANVVLVASGLLIGATRDLDDPTAQPAIDRLVSALRGVVARLSMAHTVAHTEADVDDVLATARLQLGACLEPTDPQAARSEYQAVVRSPARDLSGSVMRAQVADYLRRRFGATTGAPPTGRRRETAEVIGILSSFRPEAQLVA